jgi:hypothetical protein
MTVGVGLLLLALWLAERRERREKLGSDSTSSQEIAEPADDQL